MLDNFLKKLIPRRHREEIESNLNRSSLSVSLTVERYTNATDKIREALNTKQLKELRGRE